MKFYIIEERKKGEPRGCFAFELGVLGTKKETEKKAARLQRGAEGHYTYVVRTLVLEEEGSSDYPDEPLDPHDIGWPDLEEEG